MKPGLKQISELTGFSLATVSNALSGSRSVNAETAERVQQAAISLGYLSKRKIRRVKLVMLCNGNDASDGTPFFTQVLNGVSRGCSDSGCDMSYMLLNVNDASFREQMEHLSADLNTSLILIGTGISSGEEKYLNVFTQPVVTLNFQSENRRYNGVEINNYEAGREAAAFLLANGHRLIGYLRGEPGRQAFYERWHGFQNCLQEHQLSCREADIIPLGTDMDRAYRDMYRYLLKKPPLPTAFFADQDAIALGAMKAMQEQGIRIPDDVSVIGFGNLPYCSISSPSLTSMKVPAYEMGLLAVRRLNEIQENRDNLIVRLQVSATLQIRDSVKNLLVKDTSA